MNNDIQIYVCHFKLLLELYGDHFLVFDSIEDCQEYKSLIEHKYVKLEEINYKFFITITSEGYQMCLRLLKILNDNLEQETKFKNVLKQAQESMSYILYNKCTCASEPLVHEGHRAFAPLCKYCKSKETV